MTLADGRIFRLRPTRSSDIDALRKLFAELSGNEIRMRFLHAMSKVPETQVREFSLLDDQWAMSFVLVGREAGNDLEILGYVQIIPDPDRVRGEFAILVRADLTRMGIGRALLEHVIGHARKQGMREMYAHSLFDNTAMLSLAKALGFSFSDSGDPEAVIMTLRL